MPGMFKTLPAKPTTDQLAILADNDGGKGVHWDETTKEVGIELSFIGLGGGIHRQVGETRLGMDVSRVWGLLLVAFAEEFFVACATHRATE